MSDDSKQYKASLNLPQTDFPMKANLTQREPKMLDWWEEQHAYEAMLAAAGTAKTYMLHDGPPYANGNLHIGHALNKILKDIIIKARNMKGERAPYVPGWDCHGLPIELKVEHMLGEKKKRELPPEIVRQHCREYAKKYIDIQRKEFKRLGVLGQWDDPYITMKPAYEASIAGELANFVEKGSVVRSKKPIYWCCSCHTALAEAEVEYADETSDSIYVRFPLPDPRMREVFPALSEADLARTYVVIWTTTPWTLPSNLAVALHPDLQYVLLKHDGCFYLLADDLAEGCAREFGWTGYETVGKANGRSFERMVAKHPFYERDSLLILGEHVTLEAGTGCVHTAPGHGREDYEVGVRYGLDIYSPLDDEGRYLNDVMFFAGLQVQQADPAVIAKVEEVGNLLAKAKISHSYPHCWRCKKPVIFRATTQWFISMAANALRRKALDAIRDDVRWIPSWGEERIHNMIETRPDWCISRQRTWGVPILALLCEDCGEAWQDADWMRGIVKHIADHPTGCDYWYTAPMEDLVPAGLRCPKCGGTHWKREKDILDVWFDSGTSFAAVMEQRPELSFPADLYLEGSDQHRGWFHSSLLASVGTRGVPPYRAVLTHGYVVDGEGRKMSKSVGNVVSPDEVINKFGAEILRLWVSSVDYREDVRISEEILNRLVDAYRRIRNTCRYLLGSISDLTPEGLLPLDELDPLDRYALDVSAQAYSTLIQAYDDYEFHKVFHTLHGLCVTDLSAFYLDVLKDRLYASAPGSKERRSAQTALYHILLLLTRAMAPVLSFTAEEVYSFIPPALRVAEAAAPTIFAMPEPKAAAFRLTDAERSRWAAFLAMRADVTRAIEPLRKAGVIGHALDTRVTLYVDAEHKKLLDLLGTDLRPLFIVSQLVISTGPAPADAVRGDTAGLAVMVERAAGQKCARCWIYHEDLGSDPAHPQLCPRCTAVMHQLG